MPRVVSFQERYQHFAAKTAPDRVGPRYGASKSLAIQRFIEGSSKRVSVRELVRNILDTAGVPAGQWALYLSFAQKASMFAESYSGETLKKRLDGLKANWVARGADPAILEKIMSVFGV